MPQGKRVAFDVGPALSHSASHPILHHSAPSSSPPAASPPSPAGAPSAGHRDKKEGIRSRFPSLRRKSSQTEIGPYGPTDSAGVPLIISSCIAFLRQNALDCEGILRVSGSVAEVRRLQRLYWKGAKHGKDLLTPEFSSLHRDPHTVASLLKLFLRDADPPLISAQIYPHLVEIADLETEKLQVRRARQVLRKGLNLASMATLKVILDFAWELAQHSDKNRMNASNVARMFSPCLLRSDADSPETFLNDASAIEAVTFVLINHRDKLFKVPNPEVRTRSKRKTAVEVSAAPIELSESTVVIRDSNGTTAASSIKAHTQKQSSGKSKSARKIAGRSGEDFISDDENGENAAMQSDRDLPSRSGTAMDNVNVDALSPDASLAELLHALDLQASGISTRPATVHSPESSLDGEADAQTDSDDEEAELRFLRRKLHRSKQQHSQESSSPQHPPSEPRQLSGIKLTNVSVVRPQPAEVSVEELDAVTKLLGAPPPPPLDIDDDTDDDGTVGDGGVCSHVDDSEDAVIGFDVDDSEDSVIGSHVDAIPGRFPSAPLLVESPPDVLVSDLLKEAQQRRRSEEEARLAEQRVEQQLRQQRLDEEERRIREAAEAQQHLSDTTRARQLELQLRKQNSLGRLSVPPEESNRAVAPTDIAPVSEEISAENTPPSAPSATIHVSAREPSSRKLDPLVVTKLAKLKLLRELVLAHVRDVHAWLSSLGQELETLNSLAAISARKLKYAALLDAKRLLEDHGEEFSAIPRSVLPDPFLRAREAVLRTLNQLAAKLKDMLIRVIAATRECGFEHEEDECIDITEDTVDDAIINCMGIARAVKDVSQLVAEQEEWEQLQPSTDFEAEVDTGSQNTQDDAAAVSKHPDPSPPSIEISSSNDNIADCRAGVALNSDRLCVVCLNPLTGSFMTADGENYHETCFRCAHCSVTISRRFAVGHARGKKEIFCEDHAYLARAITNCHSCRLPFLPGQKIVKVEDQRIHSSCFKCQRCLGNLQGMYSVVNDMVCCESCGDLLLNTL